MALRRKTEVNFCTLLRSLDPSNELLGRLRSVQFVKDKIAFIEQQTTVDNKNTVLLKTLIEVPNNLEELVLNDVISALRVSGQCHVANVFRKESEEVPMSEEHCRMLNGKLSQLCLFLEPRDGLIDYLLENQVFSSSEADSVIYSKLPVNDMARQTIKILERKSDDSFDTFISALNETEQDHVVQVLTGLGTLPMSAEHRKLLQSKKKQLLLFLDPLNGVLSELTEANAVSLRDEQRILNANNTDEMARELVDTLMRKSDGAFGALIEALNKTGQGHVTYVLTGEGEMQPITEEWRAKLMEKRVEVVRSIRAKCLMSKLVSSGVLSLHDQQRVEGRLTNTERSEMIVDLIGRKSQSAFDGFIFTLKHCHHEHVAEELVGPEVSGRIQPHYSTEVTTDEDRIEAELCEHMQRALENETEVKECLSSNGISVTHVAKGSIIVKFRCRDHAALTSLQKLYRSQRLDELFTEVFCPRFVEKGLRALRTVIADEEFERHEELKLMTPEHREALESSEKRVISMIKVDDDLLNKLALCNRQREEIMSAAKREQQVKILLEIMSCQPDVAFSQFLSGLNDTGQHEAASIISGGYEHTTEDVEMTYAEDVGLWDEADYNLAYLVRSIHALIYNRPNSVRTVEVYRTWSALFRVINAFNDLRELRSTPTSRWWISKQVERLLSITASERDSSQVQLMVDSFQPEFSKVLVNVKPGRLSLSVAQFHGRCLLSPGQLDVSGFIHTNIGKKLRRWLYLRTHTPLFNAMRVAVEMRRRNVLSSSELSLVKSEQGRPRKAVKRMIHILMTKSDAVLAIFLDCLIATRQINFT